MNTETCSRKNVQAYLAGSMTTREESEFIQHLDLCGYCRDSLDSLAGDEKQWHEVHRYLSSVVPQPTTQLEIASGEAHDELPLSVQQILESLNPTDDPHSLGRLDTFEVIGVIGSGAMGVVLKAMDHSLERIVALKVMNPSLAASGAARERFAREAKAAAAILHPNVVAIHGVCTSSKLPYLVMSFFKGETLQRRVERQGALSLTEILRIGSQIADGLAAAHQQGVIHRDIKPANIMLDSGVEAAVITDFGLARTIDDATMTRTGVITGTPEYMSPEQARGEQIDDKSDVFSLGSLLYTLCTGHPPFRAQTAYGVLRRITDDEPRPIRSFNPEIPTWLCQLILRLLEKSPTHRPNAVEIHLILEGCLAHVQQPDQIPLPESCEPATSPNRAKLSSPFLVGIAMFLSSVFVAATLLFPQPSDGGGADDNSKKGPMPEKIAIVEAELKDKEKIFKTLNLNLPSPDKPCVLVVDINRGFIEVVTHDKPEIIIDVLYPPVKSTKPDDLKVQFAPQFDLRKDTEQNLIKLDTYNQNYVLNLKVRVPRRIDLSLDSYYDGYLKVSNVEGKILAESQHGDITLENISGSAKAYSRNGDLRVSLRSVSASAELDFESYNGVIDLQLPKDIKMSTAISAGRGTFRSEFNFASEHKRLDVFKKLSDDEYNFGDVSGGGIPLRIEGENGLITIRKFKN